MPMIKNRMSVALVSLLLVLGLCRALPAADPALVVPFKIQGYVAFCEGYLDMMIEITKGGTRMSRLDVRLNGQPAEEISAGSYNYRCVINGAMPVPGRNVTITIAKPSLLPSRSTPFITATGKIHSLLNLTAPANGDTISPLDREVTVSYNGGASPYSFSICQILAGNRCGDVDFHGCPGMGCAVPMHLLIPGERYSFNLFAPIGKINFEGPVKESHIILRQHHSHVVTISAIRRDM
ncbi:MAG: hypothetical protein MUP71_12615 [Candidatus Aminicenantes bacterium]|nr:hypothetical protein [Candidatus Aminicenantes bacterium]